jgi:hypothetical protein
MTREEKIHRLEAFKGLVKRWEEAYDDPDSESELRSAINREKSWVRQQVISANCFQSITISPPPALGGLVMDRVDPFAMHFEDPYGMSLTSVAIDMVDETIGLLSNELNAGEPLPEYPIVQVNAVQGYVFIVMPMAEGRHDLDDVHDSIKEAAARCGLHAERVDEPHTTDRITDRILESIRRAEYIIADLSEAKPNVYFEAGYAHALRKTPIYIARAGTKLEFDLKDYPVIFFNGMRELKDGLERRLRGIAATKGSG